jgi:cell division protein FtsL
MLRFVNACLVLGLVALAYGIYQVKYETRAFDAEIASLGTKIDDERDAIAVLRAEWSLLNRPERIERLAKKYLKLAPAKPLQLVTVDTVSDRDFDRTRIEVAAPAPEQAPKAKGAKPAVKEPAVAGAPATPATGEAASATAPWPEAKVVRPVEASAH